MSRTSGYKRTNGRFTGSDDLASCEDWEVWGKFERGPFVQSEVGEIRGRSLRLERRSGDWSEVTSSRAVTGQVRAELSEVTKFGADIGQLGAESREGKGVRGTTVASDK